MVAAQSPYEMVGQGLGSGSHHESHIRNYRTGSKKLPLFFISCLILLVAYMVVMEARAASPVDTQTSLSGLYNIYSPSVLDYGSVKRMWMGGWLTAAEGTVEPDCASGHADKIYYSELSGSSWKWPVPIGWTNAGYSPGKKPCYHINDPTVIKHLTYDWLYMYYTALPDDYVDMFKDNSVGFASSTDGGELGRTMGLSSKPQIREMAMALGLRVQL